ncbi:MAG: hypothetical protein A4E30_00310 [Methanomassiliicoccales archaeon PtaB.Bin215]|nr:MAG: hypothetical protein A4E30_00310 [Methanomassiliicoccales archaeon PtaB.Bin215]
MGSPERAQEIASEVEKEYGPAMSKLVNIAFGRCGNCELHVDCAMRLIDVPRAVEFVLFERDMSNAPSLASRTGGHVLYHKCLRCDRYSRCIGYYTQAPAEVQAKLKSVLDDIHGKDEAARLIEGVLRDQGITAAVLLKRVVAMWVSCKLKRKYRTAVETMREGER